MSTKREKSIDFFRGIAALNIIMIHTVFHSGDGYVPYGFRQIFLLLDVPVFFFLAGWSNAYNNHIGKVWQGIKKLWLDWGLFTICVVILEIVMRRRSFFSLYELGQAVFAFQFPSTNFPSIAWSTWFMPVYIGVMMTLGTATKCVGKYLQEEKQKEVWHWITGGMLLLFMSFHFMTGELIDIVRPILAYGVIFVIGYRSQNVEISEKKLASGIAGLLVIWAVSGKMLNIPWYNLQEAKFPPTIMYLAASGLSILLMIFFKHRIPERWMSKAVCHVGKNAICYYFAQGIGGSALYIVAPYINLHWLAKILVCYLINLCITIILAEAFAGLRNMGYRIFQYGRNENKG